MTGSLFVVATPIGNLDDMPPRALRCLREVDRVLAEDTRRTRALLSHFGISQQVERLDAEAEARRVDRWIAALDAGERLALVSDAGSPVVSDPGARLVRAAVAAGHSVTPIPGPSAVTAALMVSGFGGERFRFFGFLPRSGARRRETLESIRDTAETCVLFEAPGRVADTLAELGRIMPARQALVARELTKLHEELVRGALSDLAPREWRGEVTIVLGPSEARADKLDAPALDARIAALLAGGARAKQIAQQLALDSGWSARDIYARINEIHRAKP